MMRKTYKFSSGIYQGGFLYVHRTDFGSKITNKEELRNKLKLIAEKMKLIDVTIKIYDTTLFFFFTTSSIAPIEVVYVIQKRIAYFAEWDKEYIFSSVYDLQEEYVRKDLERFGFKYNDG